MATEGKDPMVQLLIGHGVVSLAGTNGQTALHLAAESSLGVDSRINS